MELLYGRNSVREALNAGRPVRRLLVASGAHGLESVLDAARRRRAPVEVVDRRLLDARVAGHHQGVLAEADGFTYVHLEEVLARAAARSEAPFLVALDSLQDPQNFGTLLRTALAVGVHGVLLPEHRSVAVTAAVSNASAGAVEHLAVARVTNLARALSQLKQHQVWVFGLAPDSDQVYWSADLRGGLALVVGAEGAGLGRLVRQTCDGLLRIPMRPEGIQSLNASVAGSLVLYEAFRQRGGG